MKVLIDGILIDSEKSIITLVFKDDEERIYIQSILKNMEPNPGKKRLFSIGPKGSNPDLDYFMDCINRQEEDISYVTNYGRDLKPSEGQEHWVNILDDKAKPDKGFLE